MSKNLSTILRASAVTNPITAITFFPATGSFLTGNFSLYGIV